MSERNTEPVGSEEWDDINSDPLENIYRAATILSDSYSGKKHWGTKLSKHIRKKKIIDEKLD